MTIPKNLVNYVKSGVAIPLIGSGISRPSGIATWQSMVDTIMSLLTQTGASIEEISDKYKTPDTYFGSIQKSNEYCDFIRQAVSDGFEPNELHDWLSRIPFKTILTTNWDELIEKQLGNDKINIIYDNNTASTWNESMRKQIIKIHGTVSYPSSIVFGLGSYKKFYGKKTGALISLLRNILITRPIIFLGFSLEDEHFISLLTAIHRRNESFIILPANKDFDSQKYINLGVTPIFANTNKADPYGIKTFLSELWQQTYTNAHNRIDRTNLLIRETKELKTYLGIDRTIRCRASLGPLAVPEINEYNIFGDSDVFTVETALLEQTLDCLNNVERCKLRIICCALDNIDHSIKKGYSKEGHIARLSALVKWLDQLGDRVEIVNDPRPSDINDWLVSNFSIIESRKPSGKENRLYEFGTLSVHREYIEERIKQFDADFQELVKDFSSCEEARRDFICRATEEITLFRNQKH